MKRIHLLLVFSFLAAFLACKKEADQGGGETSGGKVVFTATLEDLVSGSSLQSFWLPGDQIQLVLNDGSTMTPTLVAGGGTATGSFVATNPGERTALFAVFPTSAMDSAEGNTTQISIAHSQPTSTSPETLSVGKVGSDNRISFKNMNAVLGIQLKAGTETTKMEVTSADGSALVGTMVVDCSGAVPVVSAVNSPASTVSTTTLGAGTYYLTVVPGVHAQGLKIKTYSGEGIYTESGEYECDIDNLAPNTVYRYELKEVIPSKSYCVTVEGAGKKDGSSWENAMSAAKMWSLLSLNGITATKLNGSVFNLGAGTYDWGTNATLSYEEDVRFSIIGIKNETIFSGNNAHRILEINGEVDVEIQGVNFVGGRVTVALEGGEDGGAIKISSGTWEFTDCSFSGNKATNGGAIAMSGGSVKFVGCVFNENEALCDDINRTSGTGFGGAIDCDSNAVISISGCTFSGNVAWKGGAVDFYSSGSEVLIENTTFTANGNENTRDGGAIFMKTSASMKDCVLTGNKAKYGAGMRVSDHHVSIEGGSFKENVASGNAGAISVGEKGRLEIGNEKPVTFQGNSAASYGGALEVESFRESLGNNVRNAIFKDNQAQYGGAVAVYGKGGKATSMYFKDCTVEGNSATKDGGAFYVEDESFIDLTRIVLKNNHANNMGGAVCIHGWKGVQAFRSSFTGNSSGTGGAIYSEGSSDKYAYLFIDECSFDANSISNRYGCTININGLDLFCMNNCSVRGSYTTTGQSSYKTGLSPSWIAIDAIQTCSSISNCSIIGDTRNGADGGALTDNTALVGVMGSATHYFTNNIIVPQSEDVSSIGGETDSELIDLSYTHYNKLVKIGTSADNGGNVNGVLASGIGGLAWSAESGCWQWNGQIGGSTPSLITRTAAYERLVTLCPKFVTWCGEDIYKDQRNANRGDNWWPGAYQN